MEGNNSEIFNWLCCHDHVTSIHYFSCPTGNVPTMVEDGDFPNGDIVVSIQTVDGSM